MNSTLLFYNFSQELLDFLFPEHNTKIVPPTQTMDTLIAIKTNNFVLVACDMSVTRSLLSISNDKSKHYKINDLILSHSGNYGNATDLARFVMEVSLCEELISDVVPSVNSVSSLLQGYVHSSLRTRSPVNSTFLVTDGSKLACVDNYGLLSYSNYVCTGPAQYFLYGLLDSEYKPDMSVEETKKLLEKCIKLMKQKCIVGYYKYDVVVCGGVSENYEISAQ